MLRTLIFCVMTLASIGISSLVSSLVEKTNKTLDEILANERGIIAAIATFAIMMMVTIGVYVYMGDHCPSYMVDWPV